MFSAQNFFTALGNVIPDSPWTFLQALVLSCCCNLPLGFLWLLIQEEIYPITYRPVSPIHLYITSLAPRPQQTPDLVCYIVCLGVIPITVIISVDVTASIDQLPHLFRRQSIDELPLFFDKLLCWSRVIRRFLLFLTLRRHWIIEALGKHTMSNK